jgi:hypothetical protein
MPGGVMIAGGAARAGGLASGASVEGTVGVSFGRSHQGGPPDAATAADPGEDWTFIPLQSSQL